MAKTLAQRVREVRLERDLSLGQVAERAKLDRTHIAKIEKGERVRVSLPTLVAVCDALEYPLLAMLEDIGLAKGVTAGENERWRLEVVAALARLPAPVREIEVEKLLLLADAYRRREEDRGVGGRRRRRERPEEAQQ